MKNTERSVRNNTDVNDDTSDMAANMYARNENVVSKPMHKFGAKEPTMAFHFAIRQTQCWHTLKECDVNQIRFHRHETEDKITEKTKLLQQNCNRRADWHTTAPIVETTIVTQSKSAELTNCTTGHHTHT